MTTILTSECQFIVYKCRKLSHVPEDKQEIDLLLFWIAAGKGKSFASIELQLESSFVQVVLPDGLNYNLLEDCIIMFQNCNKKVK